MNPFQLCAFADEADASLDGQIQALRENNIGLIELRNINGMSIVKRDAAQVREIGAQLDAAGIRVWSIGSPIGKIDIHAPFAPHLDEFKHTLDIAHKLGASCIRLFSFYMDADEADANFSEVLDRLGSMVELSQGSGVTLCHENEKGIYGDVPSRCTALHRALPGLRAVFDPANFVQCGEDALDAWDKLRTYVDYLHIKDADTAQEIVPAGEGVGHIPEILARYRKQSGTVLTLEPHLVEFDGLAGLENGEKSKIGGRFSSSREAFDYAVGALNKIIAG